MFRVFCNLGVLEGEQSFRWDLESPCRRAGEATAARGVLLERHCRRHHRPRALRIAPECKEPLVT